MPADRVLAAIAAQLSLAADITRLLALRGAGKCASAIWQMAAAGYGLRTAGLVSFREEGRAVFYRLADGFPARLLGDCVLMLGQQAARHGGDRPR